MATSIIVEFNVIGQDYLPEILTESLMMTPSESYKTGEINTNSKLNLPYTETVWCLSEKETGYYATIPINNIIDKLREHKEFLISFKSNHNVSYLLRVICNIENEQVPVVEFSTSTIRFIHDIGGEIDLCTYLSFDEKYFENLPWIDDKEEGCKDN